MDAPLLLYRMHQASRLFEQHDRVLTCDDLTTIDEPDVRASRVFTAAED